MLFEKAKRWNKFHEIREAVVEKSFEEERRDMLGYSRNNWTVCFELCA
jgi:hypothetical protein